MTVEKDFPDGQDVVSNSSSLMPGQCQAQRDLTISLPILNSSSFERADPDKMLLSLH